MPTSKGLDHIARQPLAVIGRKPALVGTNRHAPRRDQSSMRVASRCVSFYFCRSIFVSPCLTGSVYSTGRASQTFAVPS